MTGCFCCTQSGKRVPLVLFQFSGWPYYSAHVLKTMMFFQNHLHKPKQNLILFLSDVSPFVVVFLLHPDLLWMFLFIYVRHNMQNLGIKAPILCPVSNLHLFSVWIQQTRERSSTRGIWGMPLVFALVFLPLSS